MSSAQPQHPPPSSPSLRDRGTQRDIGLALLGDRWIPELLTTLADIAAPQRFTDLLGATGVPRKALAERLRRLVTAGFLRREQYLQSPRRYRYELTVRGLELAATCCEFCRIAANNGPLSSLLPASPLPQGALDLAAITERLATYDPDYVARIVSSTLAPVVAYDRQYRTELVRTLNVYLACEASVSRAANELFAHRHTIRYRLGRIRELTGLDVDRLADRERLTLSLRAMEQKNLGPADNGNSRMSG